MCTCMCQDGVEFLEHWAESGVKLIQASKFGPYTALVGRMDATQTHFPLSFQTPQTYFWPLYT